MGWKHPDIALEDVVRLVESFIEILILASGRQSSGLLAHWDQRNISRAFHWALFFEKVFKTFSCSKDYLESVEELDRALREIALNASFPQGLPKISSAVLIRARHVVVEHLIHCLPLRDAHLRALLIATIKMDLNAVSAKNPDCFDRYLNKLCLHNSSYDSLQYADCSKKFSPCSYSDIATIENEIHADQDWTKISIQGLLKRQSTISAFSSAEKNLGVISKVINNSELSQHYKSLLREHLKHDGTSMNNDQLAEAIMSYQWKATNLSYFLDKRTIKLVSGASVMFSAPKIQWSQIFERLNISAERSCGNFSGKLELLLLGCITHRWSCIIKHLQSVSCDYNTTLERFSEVCNLLPGKAQRPDLRGNMAFSMESGILDYLTSLLDGQLHMLWMLSPALLAVAIPSWSPLFRLYVNQIEIQLREDSPARLKILFLVSLLTYSGHAVKITPLDFVKVSLHRGYGVFIIFISIALSCGLVEARSEASASLSIFLKNCQSFPLSEATELVVESIRTLPPWRTTVRMVFSGLLMDMFW